MLSTLKYNFPSTKFFTSIKVIDSHRLPEQTRCFIGLSKIKNSDPTLKHGYNPAYTIDNLINVDHIHSEYVGEKIRPLLNVHMDTIGIYTQKNTNDFYVFIKKDLPFSNTPEFTKRVCGRIVHYFCKLNSLELFESIEDKASPEIQNYIKPRLAKFQHELFLNGIFLDKTNKKIIITNAQKFEYGVTEKFIQYNTNRINVYTLNDSKLKNCNDGVFQTFVLPLGRKSIFDDPDETFNPIIYDLTNVNGSTAFGKVHKKIDEDLNVTKFEFTPNNSTTVSFVKVWEQTITHPPNE